MSRDIQQQVQSLNRKIHRLATTETQRATSSALNKTAAKIKTQVIRPVAKETRVQAKYVRKRVYIRRSKARTQYVRITAYRRDITLQSINPRQLKKGFSGAGRRYPDAFRAKGRNGKQQIFQRKGKARLPVDVVRIPIAATVDRVVPKVAERLLRQEYPRLLRRDLEYRAKRLAGEL